MLRIAHVLSAPSGLAGAEKLVAALAKDSGRRGHDALVLNTFESPEMGDQLRRACAPVPVFAHSGGDAASTPAARRWLRQQLDLHRPDVVHVHLARALLVTASLRRVPGRRLLLTHHHGDLFVRQGRHAARMMEALAVRRYDAVVGVSRAVTRSVVDDLHYPRERSRTIYNGWEGTPLPRDAAGERRVLCVGRLRAEKGQAVLVEAFAEVRRVVPDAVLHLVGDGPKHAEIAASAGRLGLSDSVVLHGDVADVWPHLASAAVFVQPSLVEPFGIATMEAMAAGVPVVASDTGGLAELVDPGRTGLLVPVGEPAALAEAVLTVLGDDRLATRLSDEGRQQAESFRIERMIERYHDLYHELETTTETQGGP